MTQITINIEDKSLKKILNAIDGVSIAKPAKKRKTGLDEAYEDVRAGRITHYENAEALFKKYGI